MIQINEYDKDDFDELVIEEVGNVFLVKFHSKRGGEASIRYDKNIQKKNVLDLIYLFLKMDNICKINNKLPVAKSVNKKNYVEIENLNNKKLKLCIYDPKFRSLFDLILGKYTNDRTQFLEKNDVKEMRFSVGDQQFGYGITDDCLNICLCTDNKGNIIGSEVEYMSKYLYDMFSKIGGKVSIDFVENDSKNKECIIRCGDLKISFLRNYTFSAILAMIYNYNDKRNKNKKR